MEPGGGGAGTAPADGACATKLSPAASPTMAAIAPPCRYARVLPEPSIKRPPSPWGASRAMPSVTPHASRRICQADQMNDWSHPEIGDWEARGRHHDVLG